MSYTKHEHPRYRDVMFKGNYDDPLYFEWEDKRVCITGEGSNCRIHVSAGEGWIQIPVDLHVYDGHHKAYIAPGEIRLTGEPKADAVLRLMNQLLFRANKRENVFLWFTEDGLDQVFDFICDVL